MKTVTALLIVVVLVGAYGGYLQLENQLLKDHIEALEKSEVRCAGGEDELAPKEAE